MEFLIPVTQAERLRHAIYCAICNGARYSLLLWVAYSAPRIFIDRSTILDSGVVLWGIGSLLTLGCASLADVLLLSRAAAIAPTRVLEHPVYVDIAPYGRAPFPQRVSAPPVNAELPPSQKG